MISWEAKRRKGIAPLPTLFIPPPPLRNGPNKHTPCHWDVMRWGEDLAHLGKALMCPNAGVSCDFSSQSRTVLSKCFRIVAFQVEF